MKNGKIASFFYNGVLFGVSLIRLNFSIEKNYTNFVGKKAEKSRLFGFKGREVSLVN